MAPTAIGTLSVCVHTRALVEIEEWLGFGDVPERKAEQIQHERESWRERCASRRSERREEHEAAIDALLAEPPEKYEAGEDGEWIPSGGWAKALDEPEVALRWLPARRAVTVSVGNGSRQFPMETDGGRSADRPCGLTTAAIEESRRRLGGLA